MKKVFSFPDSLFKNIPIKFLILNILSSIRKFLGKRKGNSILLEQLLKDENINRRDNFLLPPQILFRGGHHFPSPIGRAAYGCYNAHAQTYPGARQMSSGRLTLKLECQFCSNGASEECSGCQESVCSSCFEHSHRVHRIYRTQSDSSSCNIS